MIDIEERVIEIVSNFLDCEVTKEESFVNLGVDSLDIIEIIVECEQEFNIAITDNKIQKLKTVEDLVKLVQESDMQDYFESTQADLQTNE